MPTRTPLSRTDKKVTGAVRTFRVDLADGLGKIQVRGDGSLAIPARIARAGVLEYTDPKTGAVSNEYRDPKEVFAPDSLESFKGLTITIDHPQGNAEDATVSPANWGKLSIGHVGDDVRQDGMYVAATLHVKSQRGIEGVQAGELIECSGGYYCKTLEEQGESFDGVPYTHRQTEIRGNHVALGPENWGRSGNQVRMYLDARDPKQKAKGDSMDEAKKKEAAANLAAAIKALQALQTLMVGEGEPGEPPAEGETETIENAKKSDEAPGDDEDEEPIENAKTDEDDAAKAKADAKAKAFAKAKAKVDAEASTEQLVQDSIEIRAHAAKLGVTDTAKKSNREVMLAAIKHVHGEDMAAKNDGYVRAYFDSICATPKTDSHEMPDAEVDAIFSALAGKPAPKQDSNDGEETVEQVREAMLQRQRDRNARK